MAATSAATATAVSEPNPYKESMRSLLRYMGVSDYSDLKTDAPTESTTGIESIYFEWGESPAWKSFLAQIPREERYAASVRRRLTRSLYAAAQRNICLWCWCPAGMCLCADLELYREELLSHNIGTLLEITMVLHAEELMRSTNSGHIAAYILGAPIRVWGVEDDDLYLNTLTHEEEITDDCTRLTVSLYPGKEAVSVDSFVRNIRQSGGVRKRIHLLLADGTWGQATSLNRHIPCRIPRVSLDIDKSYESLFKALRKQTRETGISTLEATSMAMETCLNACNFSQEEANASRRVLTNSMKMFVDLQCLLKFQETCFSEHNAEVDLVVKKRDAVRREEALKGVKKIQEKAKNDPDARKLLLPPVLNYCYACDVFVSWFRMPEHVFGQRHLETLKRSPSFYPSEYSKDQKIYAHGHCMTENERATCLEDTEME